MLVDKGTSRIEGISLSKPHREEWGDVVHNSGGDSDDDEESRPLEAAGFASMDNLRLLTINHVKLKGRYEMMPKGIKWLQWQGCPLKSLPPDFDLKEVAVLDLSYSNIVQVQGKEKPSSLGGKVRRVNESIYHMILVPLLGLQKMMTITLSVSVSLHIRV